MCPTCGHYHETTGCPCQVTTPVQIHMPARIMTFYEPTECCPMCQGSGVVARSLRERFAEVGRSVAGLFKL